MVSRAPKNKADTLMLYGKNIKRGGEEDKRDEVV